MKRAFDLLGSFAGLVVLSPMFAALSIWIRLDSPGPIFFRQIRVGRERRAFSIYKFRSMHVGAERAGRITVGEDPRITRAGRFLRKYKLDELPQLFNVLTGEMSLVGPRPEVPEFVELYPSEVRRRILSVRPGMTDPASIRYRNENEMLARSENPRETYVRDIMPAKLKIYDEYAASQSFWTDLGIILATIRLVILKG